MEWYEKIVENVQRFPFNGNRLFVYFQAGDHKIDFCHYVALYETEKDKHIRVVPKLTRAHDAPDNLRKMSVRLATQVWLF